MKKVLVALGVVLLASHAWAGDIIITGNTSFDANYPAAFSGPSGSPAGFTVGGAASDPNAGLTLKAKGSGVVSIPGNATIGGTLGVTGAATMGKASLMPSAGVWSGSSQTQSPIYSVPNWTGTSTISGDYTPLGFYLNPQDNVDASAGSGTAGGVINMVLGSSHKGLAAGISLNVNIAGKPADSGKEYFAVAGRVSGNANAGGTSSVSSGHIYGGNFGAVLGSGGTYYDIVSPLELGVLMPTGSSSANKFGSYIMEYSGDAVQGSANDIGLAVYNQFQQTTGSGGWQTGIGFGTTKQYFPIAPTGTIMKATANSAGDSMTVANIFDFSALTSVSGYDIKMLNFTVTGAGLGQIASLSAGTGGGTFPNTGDLLASFANVNGNVSVSIDNISTGANAVSSLFFGNSSSPNQGAIQLNGTGNSTGNPVNSLTIFGKAGLYLAYGATNAIVIGSGGIITMPNVGTGTAATYACFTSGGQLISSATAC